MKRHASWHRPHNRELQQANNPWRRERRRVRRQLRAWMPLVVWRTR